MANIYLDPLDRHLERLKFTFVRYADDIVILTESRDETERALNAMKSFLHESLRLELKPAKTHFVPLREGFDFLGFTIDESGIRIKSKRLDDIREYLGEYLKLLGDVASSFGQRADALMKINSVIRGWRNYFSLPDEPVINEQMRLADGAIEEMAQEYLPASIRSDPAWLCRERFATRSVMEDTESERETLEREVKSGSGYPENPNSIIPEQWMVKDGGGQPAGKRVVVTDAPVEGDHEEHITLKEGIVTYNNRLYVLAHGVYLAATDQELIIRKRKEEVARLPLKELSLVFLQGFGITISVDLQLRLAEADVPVVLAPSVGEPLAVVNSVITSRSSLRGLQVVRRDDPDVITAGLGMIAAKMGNQAAVLRYFAKYRKKASPETGALLVKTAEEIRGLAAEVLALNPATETCAPVPWGWKVMPPHCTGDSS